LKSFALGVPFCGHLHLFKLRRILPFSWYRVARAGLFRINRKKIKKNNHEPQRGAKKHKRRNLLRLVCVFVAIFIDIGGGWRRSLVAT